MVLTIFNEEPVLPPEPFEYTFDFPNYLFNLEADTLGYTPGGIDSLNLSTITDDGATLGRVLFYDKKLSALENISCGTCHIQSFSFADGLDLSEGVNALTKRNSMHLNDLAWTNHDGFTWDLEHTDLVDMISIPLTDENEIGADLETLILKLSITDYYPSLFANAFGDSEVTEERIISALSQFILSINSLNSTLDQTIIADAELSDLQKEGRDIFASACGSCHVQGNHFGFTFEEGENPIEIFPFFFSNGLEEGEDLGSGEWNEHLSHLFKVPTLRNIALTGPYMHDGRFETLEEVIDHYSDGVVENEWSGLFIPFDGFQFESSEKEALLAFLQSFTDESMLENPKWSNPFDIKSMDQNSLQSSIKIVPNPSRDFARIEFSNPLNKQVNIYVTTMDGKRITSASNFENSYGVDISNYLPGTYVVQIEIGRQRSTQKLVVY